MKNKRFLVLLAITACGGRTDDVAALVQDAATEESGPQLWCGAATPGEACTKPECRAKLVYNCVLNGKTSACACETIAQPCASHTPCPPGKECVDFDPSFCFDKFCTGMGGSVCWPPD